MRLLLITLTCLSACLALPHQRQKKEILPGDPRYGTDYHQHHHHHPETVVEATKSIGYSYNIPETPITLPQFNYGPPGYQPGLPLNNDYLSPIVDAARFSLPVSTYGVADSVHIPQLTKTVVGPSISNTVTPLPLEHIKTVTVSPPATSYGTPVVDFLKTSLKTGSHHALKTIQTVPATRVTVKDVPSFAATKNVIGSTLVSENLPAFHSTIGGINLPSYDIASYAPSTYASYQPAIQTAVPIGFNGIGLKSVRVDAPLTSVGITKSIPTTYPLPQAVEIPRTTLHAPHSLTHIVQRTQPLHTLQSVKSVQPLPTVHSVQPLPTVHSVQPLPTVHSVQHLPTVHSVQHLPTVHSVQHLPTVHSVPTVHTLPAIQSVQAVTHLPSVHSVKTVSPLPSLPSVHSVEAVTPLPSLHSIEAVTPLPQFPSVHSFEEVSPLPQLPSAHSFEAVTPLPELSSAHSFEAVTPFPEFHSAHSFEEVSPVPQLPSAHSFEAVTPLPEFSSVHSVSTVSPLPHLHAVNTVSHLPLEPAHHIDTLHPSHSVEILPPLEAAEPVQSVHEVVHSKTTPFIQRGPITDFFQTVSQNFPSFPSLPSIPSFPSLPSFPVQSSTVSPVEFASPLNFHVSDSFSKDSIAVDNPLLRTDSLLDTSIEQHIAPSNGYIQPTDINGGYIY